MRRRVKQLQYRERHLAQVAQVAGMSFAVSEALEQPLSNAFTRSRFLASAAPILFALPLVASIAWYFSA